MVVVNLLGDGAEAADSSDNIAMNRKKGILLFGHGARNPEWAQPFHRIRELILAQDPAALVELGFLELMQPSFDAGIDTLVRQGANEIVVVPIFVAGGAHVKKMCRSWRVMRWNAMPGWWLVWRRQWARPHRCWWRSLRTRAQ